MLLASKKEKDTPIQTIVQHHATLLLYQRRYIFMFLCLIEFDRHSQDIHVEPGCKDWPFERFNAPWQDAVLPA